MLRSLTLAALVSALPMTALAQDYVAFRSPTGNISCAIYNDNWPFARCDISEFTASFKKRPADCDLDWEGVFVVEPNSKGMQGCVGDTVKDPSAKVLPYGKTIELGAFSCRSEKTGMTCTNRMGHGFSLSRAAQKIF